MKYVAHCRRDSGAVWFDTVSRKVLRVIAGRPMVEWVWRAAVGSGLMGPLGGGHGLRGVASGLPRAADSGGDDFGGVRERVGPREGSGAGDRRGYLRQYPRGRADADAGVFSAAAGAVDRPEVEVATLAVRCPVAEIANPNAVKV